MTATATADRIRIDGRALNYRIEGAGPGAPWLTFSNSHATDLHLWDEQAPLFVRDFHILRYDTRGHGASEAGSGSCDMAALAADVIALWDALGIERSHVIGLSLGGTTGLELAARHPGRVLSLIACDCRHTSGAEFAAGWLPRIALARNSGMEALVPSTIERWFTEGYRAKNPPALDRVRDMIRNTSIAGYIACAEALMGIDSVERLDAIRCPTLAIGGAFDPPAPPALMADMASRIEGARHEVIADASHMAVIEQPLPFNRAAAAFLASVA